MKPSAFVCSQSSIVPIKRIPPLRTYAHDINGAVRICLKRGTRLPGAGCDLWRISRNSSEQLQLHALVDDQFEWPPDGRLRIGRQ